MVREKAPLLFDVLLGMLRPANEVARIAMREIKGRVRVEIKGGTANQRRRGLYRVIAGLVVEMMNDAHGLTLDDDDLHEITLRKLRMGNWIELPSGDVYFKRASTSNRAMNEAERAEFTNRAFALWSTWTGVHVEELRRYGNFVLTDHTEGD